ncbi:hypothetical protein Q6375_01580 [Clostridium septicum]|uniref:hypothetical protein n=1 Tax=Clostridium septicum TaxID=1504 RepID=UPI00272ECE4A|nr:hypothetical protein [Clostridium septicum]WLF69739.1 hypothetical protein Q6375_01580 [Clostridium septicum]
MNDKLKSLIQENRIFIIALISTAFFTTLIVIFIFQYTGLSKTMKEFNNIAKEINKINLSLEDCVDDLTIDTKKSIETLNNSSKKLKELSSKISEVEIKSDIDSKIKSNLSDSLATTITLYDFCFHIISDSSNIKSGDEINEFNTYTENCLNSYNSLAENNIYIRFSEKSLLFFDNANNYVNTIIKINRDNDIKNIQKREFVLILDSFTSTIDKLCQDLTTAIQKVKEDKRDLKVILDDISEKDKLLEDLKNNVHSMSIPDGCMEFYNSLQEFLKIYDVYIKSMKEAVTFEKGCSDLNKYSKEIDRNYENAKSKFQDVLNSYDKYKNMKI